MQLECPLPIWTEDFFLPARYKIGYGGRGAARSWSVARILLIKASMGPLRVLCARELQRSIADSVHKLLTDQITLLNLPGFLVTQREIKHVGTGATFIFEGLRHNATKIKSLEGIDICWVEEAERISQNSWDVLIPTIRKEGSEIWITFNPDLESDPTYQRFVVNAEPNWIVKFVSWADNPWFPETLRIEKDYAYRVDPVAADWIWGGQCRRASAAAILNGKYIVERFDPEPGIWQGPYHGGDFGLVDPTAATRCWIYKRRLFIERESYQVGLDTDKIKVRWQHDIPDIHRYIIRADSSRPETISYLKRHGLSRIVPVVKWSGSVEDGIAYLRHFEEIVIHERCINTIMEARLYSYKVDEQTGDILPVIVDKHNHAIDSIRYALAPIIRAWKKPMTGYHGQAYSGS